MEPVNLSPPKLRRANKISNIHVSECVRQFRLPQQFPSTILGHKPIVREYQLRPVKSVKQVNKTHPKIVTYIAKSPRMSDQKKADRVRKVYQCSQEKFIHKISSPITFNETRVMQTNSAPVSANAFKFQKVSSNHILPKEIETLQKINSVSTTFVTNNEMQGKLQTLKLKSPDGKELGEFQVTVLDQEINSRKRKLVSVSKKVSSKDESQDCAIVSSTQGESVISYSIQDVQYPGAIYQEPRIIKIGNDANKVKIISDITMNKTSVNQATMSIRNKKKELRSQENNTLESISNSKIKHPWIKIDSKKVVISTQENGKAFKVTNNKVNNKQLFYLRPEDHPYLKNITQSGKVISLKPLQLKSLNINKNRVLKRNKSSEISNFMETGGLLGYKNGDMDEELEDEEVTTLPYSSDSGKVVINNLEENLPKSKKPLKVMSPKTSGNDDSSHSYSGSSSDMGSLQYSEEEEELISSETLDTDDSLEKGNMLNNKNTETKESKNSKNAQNCVQNRIKQRYFEITNKKTENLKKKVPSEPSEKEASSDMSIIEKALTSVKDKSLRDEALKILASCKLGADRQIPIRSPSNTLSVRNTTTQTNIFGNLESNCEEFIEVKEDVNKLKRIKKQTKYHSVDSKFMNTILSSVDENHCKAEYTSQLDKMLNNLDLSLRNKLKVHEIQEVLNKPIKSNERMENIRKQIEKDNKILSDYDENGLLGLHKAVLEDNILVVRRLLVIMKVSKRDIDMKTRDGKTSLELALKTDAGPDIVNALLEAGAKPTTKEVGHDSALIIASKNSSPLLPQLVKYANREELGLMDLDGFAAIHHCALRGNVAAISALIGSGADIDLADCRSGRTALFHAIENQHQDTAHQLLAAGAKPNIRNNDGQTILPLLDDVKFQCLKPVVYKSLKL